ncbi:MAG TPA: NADH-ubiquinone oxidoreductase-F iron-sulfur binding region domain-containing protein [Bacillota bacterium]|nr:NADH-ubiquinone oxidoreductase-F iron-sulfur binding region domain-containing protein [Bacillota bacterium]
MAAGAEAIRTELLAAGQQFGLTDIAFSRTGCIGLCAYEPMMEVHREGQSPYFYVNLTPERVREIAKEDFSGGKRLEQYILGGEPLKAQVRIALRNCGVIDPDSLEDYIAQDGYLALGTVLSSMQPADVVTVIKNSGLRGRGGGGFPTGLKWEFTAKAQGDQKYVICNADEGDPGAFMDRSILEGDPHAIIEAMVIAGYAVGASEGYIYVRAEYPLAVDRLYRAIAQAEAMGLLGEGIMGSDFSFRVHLKLGSGAFVCGEETALIASIEGLRGMPRPRPPFPANKGLWGKPTLINNVETFANVPTIIRNGADWFSAIGTEKSKGTKVFALGGNINKTGLVEVPMGTSLREVVYTIGGGLPGGKAFKAAQTGGPSGGCIPVAHIDTPIDYDSLLAIGSMMGSGGLIVIDEHACMVDVARFFLEFTVDESCGKCPPCRVGTRRMLQILERITSGQGTEDDIQRLKDLAEGMKLGSLCGLGQSAPNPVMSTLRYFEDEYYAHVREQRCPAGVCTALTKYWIDPEKCRGCTLCVKVCPVSAITGKVKEIHEIDRDVCINCGACQEKCPFDAISRR